MVKCIHIQGRLTCGDGSIYDGTWHYGKKSGLGTFYFSNGDVFQGSWREDVMNGKVCLFLFKIKFASNLVDRLMGHKYIIYVITANSISK